MNKQLVLLFFLLATTSSLMFVTSAYSLVDELPAPKFTLKLEDNSYDVPTTYETDQYTGETVVKRRGYTVEDKKIILTIENMQVDSFNILAEDCTDYYLQYLVRAKGKYGESWDYGIISSSDCPKIALSALPDSDYTVCSISVNNYPSNAQIDFQVRAVVGHYHEYWVEEYLPRLFWGSSESTWGHYVERWEQDATSGWSETQTLNIASGSTTGQPDQATLILAGALILIPVATGLGLLIRIGRKNS